MLPSADKLFGDADFLFQQDVTPAHSAKTITNWFADDDITVPTRLTCIVKRKMRNRRAEGRYQSILGFNNGSAVAQADRLHATPH